MSQKFSETCHNAKRCLHFVKTPLSWGDGGIGKHLLAMAIYGVVFFGILMLIETGIGKRLWYVCVYVCISYAYMYLCIVCVCVCVCLCVRACVRACVRVCACACMFICVNG